MCVKNVMVAKVVTEFVKVVFLVSLVTQGVIPLAIQDVMTVSPAMVFVRDA